MTTPVNLWIKSIIMWINSCSRLYFCRARKEVLNKMGYRGIIAEICQNERTNHTHATVQKHTVFVLVLQPKLDVPFLSADAQKVAQK